MQETELKNKYMPLFRKYRPQTFKDVIGQEFTVRALENAIKLNKLANAYLFCGPRGTGKTSSARIFAKSLNCEGGPTVTPCGKCQSCLDVANASGIDVIEIDAATNRGIEDAKELIAKVQYAPMNGKYKIFIIDEVHMLSKEAFNALLKTFEEPPSNVIFILATTEPHKVIETIVSRCQRFDFRRITIEDITKRLRQIADIEKINITDDALFAIAKNVSGGMRDSLALLDQASVLGIEKQITKDVIESLIGKLTFNILYDLTDSVLSNDTEAAVQKVETIYLKGSEPRNFIENYIEFLKNTILILNAKDVSTVSNLTLIDVENVEKIKNNKIFNSNKLVKILDKVIEFYKEIKTSTNPYLWAELAIICICSIDILEQNTKNDPINLIKQNEIQPALPKEKPTPIYAQNQTQAPTIENSSSNSTNKKDNSTQNNTLEPNISVNNSNYPEKEVSLDKNLNTDKNLSPNTTQVATNPANSDTSQDAAQIWAKIINSVSSVPAKFFYSGVGKLVNIKNKHITLGFVNENALSQAKSDNKYNPLLKSIQEVLGESGSIEFIIIDKNTKIINANVVPKQSPQNFQAHTKPSINSETPLNNEASSNFNDSKKASNSKSDFSSEEESEDKADLSSYPPTTRQMLETYNGRVVE